MRFIIILITIILVKLTAMTGAAAQDRPFQLTTSGCAVVVPELEGDLSISWTGSCIDGKLSGSGKLTLMKKTTQLCYIGQMKNGMKTGLGSIYFPDKSILSGFFEENNVLSQSVSYTSSDGSHYVGEWINGPEGLGVKEYSNHATYAGHWHKGQRSGEGTFKLSNGNRYSGHFISGKFDGWGVMETSDGDKFLGNWAAGAMSGFGQIIMHNGLEFEGDIKDGKRDGLGTLKSPNGDSFRGNWHSDVPEGKGVLTLANGTFYSGEWGQGCLRVGESWITAFVAIQNCEKQ